jgi:hypothetical protein
LSGLTLASQKVVDRFRFWDRHLDSVVAISNCERCDREVKENIRVRYAHAILTPKFKKVKEV